MSLQSDIRNFIENTPPPTQIKMKRGRKPGGNNKSTYRYKITNLENDSYKLYTSYKAIAKEYKKSLLTVQLWKNYPQKIKEQFNIKLEKVDLPGVKEQKMRDTYEPEPEPEANYTEVETENYIKNYKELEAKYNKLKNLYLAQL